MGGIVVAFETDRGNFADAGAEAAPLPPCQGRGLATHTAEVSFVASPSVR